MMELDSMPFDDAGDVINTFNEFLDVADSSLSHKERLVLSNTMRTVFTTSQNNFKNLFDEFEHSSDIDHVVQSGKTSAKLAVEYDTDSGFFEELIETVENARDAINGEWSAPEPRDTTRHEAGRGQREYLDRKHEQARQVGVPPSHRP